jgi:hypothetical protein
MAGQIGDPGLYPGGAGDAGDKNFWELNPPASQTGKLTTGIAQTWTTDGSTEIFHAENNAGVAEFGIYGSPFDYTTVHTPALNYALVWNGTAFAATNIGGAGPYVQLAPASQQTGAAPNVLLGIDQNWVIQSNAAVGHENGLTVLSQSGLNTLLAFSGPTGEGSVSIGQLGLTPQSINGIPFQVKQNSSLALMYTITANGLVSHTPPPVTTSVGLYNAHNITPGAITGTESTTVAAANGLTLYLGQPVIAFSSANTVTTASTLYIGGAPAAGTFATITNPFGLYIDSGAAMGLAGATSGFIGMKAAATTTSYSITWPAAQASGTQVLQNNGSGTLSWATVTSGASWSGLTNPTTALALTMAAADTTTFTLQQTTQTGFTWASSTLTTGTIAAITSTSTALSGTTPTGLAINFSGANANAAVTATGVSVSVTNTNATSGTNIGLFITASGAITANYGIYDTGSRWKSVGYLDTDDVANGHSVYFGFGTLHVSTGSNNVAFGYQALYANTTANLNSAFGYQALYANTTGGTNSAFGLQALYSYNNTGGANGFLIAVGFSAGGNYTGAELHNIILGYNLGVAGESNMLRIGNPQLGAGFGQVAFSMKNLSGFGLAPIYGLTANTGVAWATGGVVLASYTPTATGQFEIQGTISATTADTVTVTVTYTDANNATAQTVTVLSAVAITTNGVAHFSAYVWATTATAVSVQLTVATNTTTKGVASIKQVG